MSLITDALVHIAAGLPPLITAAQLRRVYPYSPPASLAADAASLSHACRAGRIDTKARLAWFLGQVGQESYQLKFMREIWGPTKIQALYERDFSQPWSRVGRNAKAFKLGNETRGDGFALRGTGPLQVTGRANLRAASIRIFGDDRLVRDLSLLDDRRTGLLLAVDYWTARGINALVDAGDDRGVTRAVNGAATDGDPSHHIRRVAYRNRALTVLSEAA